jgi:hypothetical protein
MSSVIGGNNQNGLQVNAWRTNSGPANMGVNVEVDDAQVRKVADGFDGLEKPFAMVPFQTQDGNVTWKRFDIGWSGDHVKDRELVDDYQLSQVPGTADVNGEKAGNVANDLGVAVGMDTNKGTLWAQDYGQSIPVKEPGQP